MAPAQLRCAHFRRADGGADAAGDLGAKSEIYKLMTQLAEEGKSIIMISSDMPELLRLSDRVIVMCEGHVTGELDISEATQETIMTYATKREVG